MSLVPRWQKKFPFLAGKDSLNQFLSEVEQGFGALTNHNTGVSISSDNTHVYIEAQVPGLSAKDVDVSIDNEGVLWIKGEKIEEEDCKERHYYRKSQSTYSYCVPLWDEVDTTLEPEASYKNGIMTITFTKKKEKQIETKKIKVKEGK